MAGWLVKDTNAMKRLPIHLFLLLVILLGVIPVSTAQEEGVPGYCAAGGGDD